MLISLSVNEKTPHFFWNTTAFNVHESYFCLAFFLKKNLAEKENANTNLMK